MPAVEAISPKPPYSSHIHVPSTCTRDLRLLTKSWAASFVPPPKWQFESKLRSAPVQQGGQPLATLSRRHTHAPCNESVGLLFAILMPSKRASPVPGADRFRNQEGGERILPQERK
ncbi:hypothetical protein TrVFT333_008691 [Trichoderma virens FT-333]|nr:hypothetical protein TrVFT333_008691 [Trichoderma virens FT-333]